jgi:hypothetical protein
MKPYLIPKFVASRLLAMFAQHKRPRAFTKDAIGASLELRNAWITGIINTAGANARIRLYNGARPATGGTPTGTLLATLVMGTLLGNAVNGVLDFDEASMTQTNTGHVNGTPTWLRIEKSGGTFVADLSIPADATFSGSVVNGVNITLNPSTITAPNA